MKNTLIDAIAVIAALVLFGAQIALANPMLCSGELKTCIANCTKLANRAAAPICVTDCRTQQSICMQTGCWNNGRNRVCGLARR